MHNLRIRLFRLHIPQSAIRLLTKTDFRVISAQKNLGFVTPIKAQQYNDCWAVAGTEGFETKLLKLGYPVTEMSHDHANASSTTQTNGKGWQRKYRDGGFTNIYPGYLTSWQGGAEIADVGKIVFFKKYLRR